ncbi:MAG: DUF11 domain-containing protein [Deltaproteobacteria bacterium]|nr:DUF11 domain-containing protein [Deltaproteobacteria bacterium]
MRKILFMLITAMLIFAPAAWAADDNPIKLINKAEVEVTVVNKKGKKEVKLIDAALAEVTPGDVVLYTILFENTGSDDLEDIVIHDPIPENTVYIGGTAKGENTDVTFSIDGGKSYDVPEKLIITESDGKKRVAKPSEYSNIRWKVNAKLSSGFKGSVSFRVKLE